jgi:hypothetical protein
MGGRLWQPPARHRHLRPPVARSILSAVVVALLGVSALFAVNLGATRLAPEHYRTVVTDAVRNGTMGETLRQTFAPNREIYLVGGSDCLILAMLVTERDTPVRASISPRMPVLFERVVPPPAPGFGRDEVCRTLAWAMEQNAGAVVPVQIKNHHRYLHASLTLATLVLAVVPLHAAEWLLLLACYAALAALATAAALRMRSPEPAEQRRALAFLIIAGVLAAFYALPIFGRLFSHAPTDIVLVMFLLVGLLHPLCRLPERHFALIVAAFGTAIAMLELLTGGIPMGLAVLIALVALGGAPDAGTMWRRLVVGVACYLVAMATCFAAKLGAIAIAWGTGEVIPLFDMLGSRMTGAVGSWPALEQWLARFGFDADVIDRRAMARRLLGGAMVTYSAFVLAWGSHVLGALFVIVPVPLLVVLTYIALRRVRRDEWLAQPQPLLLAASLVPFAWYAAFPWHTITHSFFMVRPLALNVAFAAIAVLMLPARRAPVASRATAGAGAG